MIRLLICWIGATDLRAPSEKDVVGLGPICQALKEREFDEIALISDYGEDRVGPYLKWLSGQTPKPTAINYVNLSSPTDFRDIYQAASQHVSKLIEKRIDDVSLTFHLSPGTPQMAAVWIILAKTKYPAELIESSQKYGVKTTSFPFDISADLIPDLFRARDKGLVRLAAGLPAVAPEFDDIIHRSERMQRVILKARRVAPRTIPVLIEGESGTGKELFARAIHEASPRKERPFIAINCGSIPASLVESELFGHDKGAFTGANAARVGHFEAAHTGTIFLDEIGELPKEIQVKLLRTVQEGEVKRIGANQPRKVDIRIIAATNRNLIEEVAAGSFREDLFYRLAVAMIKLPPLREREGDVSLLIDQFLGRINRESSNEPGYLNKKISASARNLLLSHSWPGNVRELQNTLTRAAVWSVDEELCEDDIREALLPIPASAKGGEIILNQSLEEGIDLPEIMKTVAVHYLERGLSKSHDNKTKAAKLLGLSSYQTLTNWLKRYGLE